MPRRGRCAFCQRPARAVVAVWSWQVVGRRRLRHTQLAESRAVCAEHAERLRRGRLLLLDDRAHPLRAGARVTVVQPPDPADPRTFERRYLREASAIRPTPAATREQCSAMTPSGGRCRHQASASSDLCAQHAMLRRRGLPVVRVE